MKTTLTFVAAVAPTETRVGGVVSTTTVSTAALLVAMPKAFVTTQRKVAPLSAAAAADSVYEDDVAPAMFAPPRCHW